MNRTRALAVLVMTALAAVLALLLTELKGPKTETVKRDARIAHDSEAAASDALATPETKLGARKTSADSPAVRTVEIAAPVVAVQVPVPSPAPVPRLGSSLVALTGRVVIVEPDGRETHDASGMVHAYIHGRRDAAERVDGTLSAEITLDEGRFAVSVLRRDDGTLESVATTRTRSLTGDAEDLDVHVGAYELEGGSVVAFIDDKYSWGGPTLDRFGFGERDVVLRLRRVPEVTVHVVAAATGAALEDVRLVVAGYSPNLGLGHPGGDRYRVEHAAERSPIRFQPDGRASGNWCFARSAGYAWKRIPLDFDQGGERTVALERGGDLTVKLMGELGGEHWIRLYREPAAPFAERVLTFRGSVEFAGLPTGDYEVRVERGKSWRDAAIRHRADTIVRAGQAETVAFAIEPAPLQLVGRIAGTLVVPPEWSIPRFLLDLTRIDPETGATIEMIDVRSQRPTPVEGSDDCHAFDLGSHPVGRYHLRVRELSWAEIFDLTSAGRTDLELVVPPPVEMFVVVENARDRTVADVNWITWIPIRTLDQRWSNRTPVERPQGEDRFRVLVPACEVEIMASSEEYVRRKTRVVPVPNSTVRLALEPAAQAMLRFESGGTVVPWPRGFGKIEPVGHDGRMTSRGWRRKALWVQVSAPGLYRVELPRVEGFDVPATVDVEVVAGKRLDEVIRIEETRR